MKYIFLLSKITLNLLKLLKNFPKTCFNLENSIFLGVYTWKSAIENFQKHFQMVEGGAN